MATTAGFESTDTMHYHSRAIRDGLKASIQRLEKAKAHIPPPLVNSNRSVQQDWLAPSANADFDKSDDLRAADNLRSGLPEKSNGPLFADMRRTLSEFEQAPGYDTAPSRERAFYSALRTLLSDISAISDAEERDTRSRAAHKWFSKHRPRGLTEDPAIFAAMAASLSLGGLQQQPQQHQQQQQHHQRSDNPVLSMQSGGKPFAPQGTKHEFFASYSKEAPVSTQQQHAALIAESSRQSLAPQASRLQAPTPGMPVVLQPAVPGARPTASARSAPLVSSSSRVAAAAGFGGGGGGGLDADVATVPVPRLKSRVVFDPEKMGPTGSGAGAGAGAASGGAAPSWFSGPFREGGNRAANTRGTIERMANRGMNPEQAELEALRQKWAEMDAQSGRTVAHVEKQVQRWSLQRARLEEEIIRRQEASRFASPSMHHHYSLAELGGNGTGGLQQQRQQPAVSVGGEDGGYMSPYRHVVSDQLGLDAEGAASRMPGLLLQTTVTSTAREVRARAKEEHAREVAVVSRRLQELGLEGTVTAAALDRALAPVPDKAYLECLAKLPKPGDHLPSRPGSGAPATRPRSSSKKKKATKKSS